MFILRIFFSGLIAFVPREDGKVTVLLLNTPHEHHGKVRSGKEAHQPMLLARAGGCEPECPRSNPTVSKFLFPYAASGPDILAKALQDGVVWELSGSDLSLGIPNDGVQLVRTVAAAKSVPDTEAERADFGWVASLKKIDSSTSGLRPAIISGDPPEELIAARLTLSSGKISTYSIIRVDDDVMPIEFRPPSGKGKPYTRAAASWVVAEIEVPGDSLEIMEERFNGGGKRTISLKPLEGKIDMAILNITSPRNRTRVAKPGPGTHFARFWDLTVKPPAAKRRSIPQVARASVERRDFEKLHPTRDDERSFLLETVFPGERTPYDQLLCPMSQIP
jgi:hypothetical protein